MIPCLAEVRNIHSASSFQVQWFSISKTSLNPVLLGQSLPMPLFLFTDDVIAYFLKIGVHSTHIKCINTSLPYYLGSTVNPFEFFEADKKFLRPFNDALLTQMQVQICFIQPSIDIVKTNWKALVEKIDRNNISRLPLLLGQIKAGYQFFNNSKTSNLLDVHLIIPESGCGYFNPASSSLIVAPGNSVYFSLFPVDDDDEKHETSRYKKEKINSFHIRGMAYTLIETYIQYLEVSKDLEVSKEFLFRFGVEKFPIFSNLIKKYVSLMEPNKENGILEKDIMNTSHALYLLAIHVPIVKGSKKTASEIQSALRDILVPVTTKDLKEMTTTHRCALQPAKEVYISSQEHIVNLVDGVFFIDKRITDGFAKISGANTVVEQLLLWKLLGISTVHPVVEITKDLKYVLPCPEHYAATALADLCAVIKHSDVIEFLFYKISFAYRSYAAGRKQYNWSVPVPPDSILDATVASFCVFFARNFEVGLVKNFDDVKVRVKMEDRKMAALSKAAIVIVDNRPGHIFRLAVSEAIFSGKNFKDCEKICWNLCPQLINSFCEGVSFILPCLEKFDLQALFSIAAYELLKGRYIPEDTKIETEKLIKLHSDQKVPEYLGSFLNDTASKNWLKDHLICWPPPGKLDSFIDYFEGNENLKKQHSMYVSPALCNGLSAVAIQIINGVSEKPILFHTFSAKGEEIANTTVHLIVSPKTFSMLSTSTKTGLGPKFQKEIVQISTAAANSLNTDIDSDEILLEDLSIDDDEAIVVKMDKSDIPTKIIGTLLRIPETVLVKMDKGDIPTEISGTLLRISENEPKTTNKVADTKNNASEIQNCEDITYSSNFDNIPEKKSAELFHDFQLTCFHENTKERDKFQLSWIPPPVDVTAKFGHILICITTNSLTERPVSTLSTSSSKSIRLGYGSSIVQIKLSNDAEGAILGLASRKIPVMLKKDEETVWNENPLNAISDNRTERLESVKKVDKQVLILSSTSTSIKVTDQFRNLVKKSPQSADEAQLKLIVENSKNDPNSLWKVLMETSPPNNVWFTKLASINPPSLTYAGDIIEVLSTSGHFAFIDIHVLEIVPNNIDVVPLFVEIAKRISQQSKSEFSNELKQLLDPLRFSETDQINFVTKLLNNRCYSLCKELAYRNRDAFRKAIIKSNLMNNLFRELPNHLEVLFPLISTLIKNKKDLFHNCQIVCENVEGITLAAAELQMTTRAEFVDDKPHQNLELSLVKNCVEQYNWDSIEKNSFVNSLLTTFRECKKAKNLNLSRLLLMENVVTNFFKKVQLDLSDPEEYWSHRLIKAGFSRNTLLIIFPPSNYSSNFWTQQDAYNIRPIFWSMYRCASQATDADKYNIELASDDAAVARECLNMDARYVFDYIAETDQSPVFELLQAARYSKELHSLLEMALFGKKRVVAQTYCNWPLARRQTFETRLLLGELFHTLSELWKKSAPANTFGSLFERFLEYGDKASNTNGVIDAFSSLLSTNDTLQELMMRCESSAQDPVFRCLRQATNKSGTGVRFALALLKVKSKDGNFLFSKAAVDNTTNEKNTYLHYAVIIGDYELVKFLIAEFHCDLNARNGNMKIPKMLSHKRVLSLLASRVITVGEAPGLRVLEEHVITADAAQEQQLWQNSEKKTILVAGFRAKDKKSVAIWASNSEKLYVALLDFHAHFQQSSNFLRLASYEQSDPSMRPQKLRVGTHFGELIDYKYLAAFNSSVETLQFVFDNVHSGNSDPLSPSMLLYFVREIAEALSTFQRLSHMQCPLYLDLSCFTHNWMNGFHFHPPYLGFESSKNTLLLLEDLPFDSLWHISPYLATEFLKNSSNYSCSFARTQELEFNVDHAPTWSVGSCLFQLGTVSRLLTRIAKIFSCQKAKCVAVTERFGSFLPENLTTRWPSVVVLLDERGVPGIYEEWPELQENPLLLRLILLLVSANILHNPDVLSLLEVVFPNDSNLLQISVLDLLRTGLKESGTQWYNLGTLPLILQNKSMVDHIVSHIDSKAGEMLEAIHWVGDRNMKVAVNVQHIKVSTIKLFCGWQSY